MSSFFFRRNNHTSFLANFDSSKCHAAFSLHLPLAQMWTRQNLNFISLICSYKRWLFGMNRRWARGGCGCSRHAGASSDSTVKANLQSQGKLRVPVTTPSHTAWSISNFCGLGSPSALCAYCSVRSNNNGEEKAAFRRGYCIPKWLCKWFIMYQQPLEGY